MRARNLLVNLFALLSVGAGGAGGALLGEAHAAHPLLGRLGPALTRALFTGAGAGLGAGVGLLIRRLLLAKEAVIKVTRAGEEVTMTREEVEQAIADAGSLAIDLDKKDKALRLTIRERDAAEDLIAEIHEIAGEEGDLLAEVKAAFEALASRPSLPEGVRVKNGQLIIEVGGRPVIRSFERLKEEAALAIRIAGDLAGAEEPGNEGQPREAALGEETRVAAAEAA